MKKYVRIDHSPLGGALCAMPSKSVSHRLAICAALAGGSTVSGIGLSEDIRATCGALAAMGYPCSLQDDALIVGESKREGQVWDEPIDCGESGSTLRFLLPLALDGKRRSFTGRGRLLARPMDEYARLFAERGIGFVQTSERIEVCGKLSSGRFSLRGDVSSQFISGLLFALPILPGDSRIDLTTPLESRAYVDLTIDSLNAFGVHAAWDGESAIEVPGGQSYAAARVAVEGDYSHAAFWLAAGLLGSGTALSGLAQNSRQGDAAIVEVLRGMGADVVWRGRELFAAPSALSGLTIDVSQIPDLFPILSVLACAAEGETSLINASRLRIKESDRLQAMAVELKKLGADVEERADTLRIRGSRGKCLRGTLLSSHGDHRIAMALAVAASLCDGPVVIENPGVVAKSAPDFWREYADMGGCFGMLDEWSGEREGER